MHSSQPKSILSAHLPSANPDVVWLALIERAVKDLALGGLRYIVGHYLQQAPRQSELLTKSDCRTTMLHSSLSAGQKPGHCQVCFHGWRSR